MAWGDLDNDGDIDLAITGINAENNSVFDIYYRENEKDNFIKEVEFDQNSDQYKNGYLEIVDIDLDGDNDIKYPGGIVLNSFFRSSYNSYSYYYVNQSNGNSDRWNRPNKNSSLGFIKLSENRLDYIEMGDNNEGDLVSNSNYFGINNLFLRNGDIAVGDYDNNGYDDIVFTGEDVNGVPFKLYISVPRLRLGYTK